MVFHNRVSLFLGVTLQFIEFLITSVFMFKWTALLRMLFYWFVALRSFEPVALFYWVLGLSCVHFQKLFLVWVLSSKNDSSICMDDSIWKTEATCLMVLSGRIDRPSKNQHHVILLLSLLMTLFRLRWLFIRLHK